MVFSAILLVIPSPGILLACRLISSKFDRDDKCLKKYRVPIGATKIDGNVEQRHPN